MLSAGQSSRMGEDKALLEVSGSSIIQSLLSKLSEIAGIIYLVLGDNYDTVTEIIARREFSAKVNCIFNENHNLGMFSSIQKGLSAIGEGYPVLLQMVDQPFVPLSIYEELISIYDEEHYVFQPSYHGRAGHPILLSDKFIKIVLSHSVTGSLRELIWKFPEKRKFLEVENFDVLQNINTKEDLNRAVLEKSRRIEPE